MYGPFVIGGAVYMGDLTNYGVLNVGYRWSR